MDADDVLYGWDTDADAREVAGWNLDRRPLPMDTIAVGTACVVGLILGLSSRVGRLRGAVFGAVFGAGVMGALRQIWRLPPP